MAETLANGTTIPQGSDPIHGSGVQAMRNLGGSVDGQLGNRYTKAQADALLAGKAASSHTHPVSQVTGLQAALDAKVGSTDPRLSDARTPLPHGHQVGDVEGLDAALDAAGGSASWAQVTNRPSTFPPSAHTHAVADVTGLANRLTELERDTGPRILNSLITGYISGDLILQRVGKNVYLTINELEVAPNNGATTWSVGGFLPAGFRFFPPAYKYFSSFARTTGHNRGEIRADRYGGIDIYNVYNTSTGTALKTNVSAVWATTQAYPSTLPGTPG